MCLFSLDWYSVVESLDHTVCLFFLLMKNLHTVFHRCCPIYIPTNSTWGGPFSVHSCQHLLFLVFLIVAILTVFR